MKRFRENFYDADAPERFKWRWEEKLALAAAILWIVASAVGAYYFV